MSASCEDHFGLQISIFGNNTRLPCFLLIYKANIHKYPFTFLSRNRFSITHLAWYIYDMDFEPEDSSLNVGAFHSHLF